MLIIYRVKYQVPVSFLQEIRLHFCKELIVFFNIGIQLLHFTLFTDIWDPLYITIQQHFRHSKFCTHTQYRKVLHPCDLSRKEHKSGKVWKRLLSLLFIQMSLSICNSVGLSRKLVTEHNEGHMRATFFELVLHFEKEVRLWLQKCSHRIPREKGTRPVKATQSNQYCVGMFKVLDSTLHPLSCFSSAAYNS